MKVWDEVLKVLVYSLLDVYGKVNLCASVVTYHHIVIRKPEGIQVEVYEESHFEKLYELFAWDRATGRGSMTADKRVQQWTVQGNVHVHDLN